MSTLSTLEVPVKEGNTVTVRSLALGTTIKKLCLPVMSGGEITNVIFDLPTEGGPGEVGIAVGVHTDTPTLLGQTCTCTDSLGNVVDTKTITQDGWAVFALSDTGTYTFTITY